MILAAIAAMSENRVIGTKNKLPWHLPADLKHFKSITLGHPIIMGRKTFDSIQRPLPKRENIVISRDPNLQIPGVHVVPNLQEAILFCEGKTEEAFVVGGAQIYEMALPKIQRIYLTVIHKTYEGDTYFPSLDKLGFQEVAREDHWDNELPYSFVTLER